MDNRIVDFKSKFRSECGDKKMPLEILMRTGTNPMEVKREMKINR